MTALVIDGKGFAAGVRARVAAHVARLAEEHGVVPGLAVVLVGEDPASQVYVRNKGVQTQQAGMASFEHQLAADTSEADLLALVRALNADPKVHGILVQLPLP
ncbi:MAG: tetrahydrofolate dehydrogenase/cyclohydrolase catalytic domain-containing protein, partial [Paracoccaceae bacterium]